MAGRLRGLRRGVDAAMPQGAGEPETIIMRFLLLGPCGLKVPELHLIPEFYLAGAEVWAAAWGEHELTLRKYAARTGVKPVNSKFFFAEGIWNRLAAKEHRR